MDTPRSEDIRNAQKKIIYELVEQYTAFEKDSKIYLVKKQAPSVSSDKKEKRETLNDVILQIARKNYHESYLINLMLITDAKFFDVISKTILELLIPFGKLSTCSMMKVITRVD